jgi:spoIIIJ-associated protein
MSDVTETTTAAAPSAPLAEEAAAASAALGDSAASADSTASSTSAVDSPTLDSSILSDYAPAEAGAASAVPAPTAPSPAAAAAFAAMPSAPAPTGDDSAEQSDAASPAGAPAPSASSLDDEGDVAADYIEELLDICDLDGDIDIEVTDGRAYISVNASGDSNLRILSRPDTVAALQELTRLAVQTKTGEFARLILDVGGSREQRQRELEKLVDDAVAQLDAGSDAAHLEPMSSYERKLVHDIVAVRGLTSESEGDGRDRHTVVSRG